MGDKLQELLERLRQERCELVELSAEEWKELERYVPCADRSMYEVGHPAMSGWCLLDAYLRQQVRYRCLVREGGGLEVTPTVS